MQRPTVEHNRIKLPVTSPARHSAPQAPSVVAAIKNAPRVCV